MKPPPHVFRLGIPILLMCAGGAAAAAQPDIPEPRRAWEDWATWDVKHRECPTPYNIPDQHICFWPTTLALAADASAIAAVLEAS